MDAINWAEIQKMSFNCLNSYDLAISNVSTDAMTTNHFTNAPTSMKTNTSVGIFFQTRVYLNCMAVV